MFLRHRPFLQKELLGLFDLQLSGHTHGGHFRPADLLMRLVFGTKNGLSNYANGDNQESAILVTHGTGFGRIPLRFFIPPEIVVIDLVPEKQG